MDHLGQVGEGHVDHLRVMPFVARGQSAPERVEAGGHVTIERVEGAKLYVRPAKCPCTKA